MLPVYILLWFFSSSRRWWRDIINLESDQFAPKSMGSHTFVIEIDRQDSKEQERFRWRWPQRDMDKNSNTASGKHGTIVEELMLFLDEKVGVPTTAMGDDDDKRAGHYTVEMHDRERGGWIPLASSAFPVGNIPRNCRLRVSVPASTPNASTGKKSDSDKHRLGAIETRLALPWRRFDRDLGSGGLEVCGRKVVVQDVPNSDEGTGLFTWDGSVLLAKYVEHRASEIVGRQEDHHQPNEEREQARSRVPWEEKETSPVRLAGFRCNAGSPRRVFRVLELGCGTGLLGLASAVALGQHLLEDTMASSLRNEEGDRMADTARGMLEVVLTDLPYALENARANIARNTESLTAEGVDAVVVARELDWLRPVPPELMSEEFDLIIAADVVWLDELVEPLVRTLERLTANWASDGLDTSLECRSSTGSAIDPFARDGIRRPGGSCPMVPEFTGVICQRESGGDGILKGVTHRLEEGRENGEVRSNWGFHAADGVSERRQVRKFKRRRRILLAYQWRSERTGRALLRELARAFYVRKIPPEDCHPDYMPDTKLCLFEARRR